MLSQLSEMEMLEPGDRLSNLIRQTAEASDDELDELDLELVSAAGRSPYQEFLKRLGGKFGPS